MNSYVCHIVAGNGPGVLRAQNAHSQAISRNGSAYGGSLVFPAWDLHCLQSLRTLVTGLWCPPALEVEERQVKGQTHSQGRGGHIPLFRKDAGGSHLLGSHQQWGGIWGYYGVAELCLEPGGMERLQSCLELGAFMEVVGAQLLAIIWSLAALLFLEDSWAVRRFNAVKSAELLGKI